MLSYSLVDEVTGEVQFSVSPVDDVIKARQQQADILVACARLHKLATGHDTAIYGPDGVRYFTTAPAPENTEEVTA